MTDPSNSTPAPTEDGPPERTPLTVAEAIREAILAAPTAGKLKGPFELRGQQVYIRAFGGTERDRFEATTLELGKAEGYMARLVGLRARLIASTCCLEDGTLVFDPTDPDQLEGIGLITVEETEPLFDAATSLNRLTQADVEELVGKSET